MRIIGIDPGLNKTGWGVIESLRGQLTHIANGVIKTDAKDPLHKRLGYIQEKIIEVIQEHNINQAALEETFLNSNPISTLKLGMVRGVIMAAASLEKIEITQYLPNKVKKSVVGFGHADKNQVAMMIQRIIKNCPVVTEDAADALAVSVCHSHYYREYIR